MYRLFPLLAVFALISSCKCRQSDVIYPISPCANGTSTCMGDRAYTCGNGAWRPVGDATCASQGAVCCLDAVVQVHACVSQNRCAASSSGGM